jgi:hypothetical protein
VRGRGALVGGGSCRWVRGAKVDLVVVRPSQGLLTEGAHRSVEEGSDGEEVYADGSIRSEVRKSTS